MAAKKFFDIFPPGEKKRLTKKSSAKTPKKKAGVRRPKKRKKSVFKTPSLFLLKNYRLLIYIAAALVAVLIIFLQFSAKADIEIWPKMEELAIEEKLVVDSDVSKPDFSAKIIPGYPFAKEKSLSQEFEATGLAGEGAKAKGTIKVFNDYHLNQVLVATTRFISANGKLFRSTHRVEVPAGGTINVQVESAELGPDYNIKPTTFSIPGLSGSARYTAVYGKSSSAMTGGFVGEVSQVTEEDLEKAEEALFNQLTSSLREELQALAGDSFTLLEGAGESEILEKSSSQEEGGQAEKFTFYLKMRSEILAFKKSELEDFGLAMAMANVPEGQELHEESLQLESTVEQVGWETGQVSIQLKVEANLFVNINLDDLKTALAGKGLNESQALLRELSELEKIKIQLFPFWLQRIPQNLNRIEVSLNLGGVIDER